MWYHFEFTSGANPFIAFEEKTAKKNVKFWRKKGWSVEKIIDGFYRVYDKSLEVKTFC